MTSTFAFFEWHRRGESSGPKITLSTRLRGALSELIDTMVHEMIHVWQYHQYLITGEARFLDVTPQPGHAFHSSWHGRYFYEWVNALNSRFPEMNLAAVRDGFPADLGLVSEKAFGVHIVFEVNGESMEALYHSRDDLTDCCETLISEILDLYGPDTVDSVAFFETESPDIKIFPSLTQAKSFRVNQKHCAHESVMVDRVISHTLTRLPVVMYQGDKNQTESSAFMLSLSPDAKSRPYYDFLDHLRYKQMAYVRRPFIDTQREDDIYRTWFEVPISEALESANGRALVRDLILALAESTEHKIGAFRQFWHRLGPGRYSAYHLAMALVKHPVFEEACQRLFMEPDNVRKRILSMDFDYLLSSFRDVKETAKLTTCEWDQKRMEALMVHFGVPIQEPLIDILLQINRSRCGSVNSH